MQLTFFLIFLKLVSKHLKKNLRDAKCRLTNLSFSLDDLL